MLWCVSMLRGMLCALVIAISLTSTAGQYRTRPTLSDVILRELYSEFLQRRLPTHRERQYVMDLHRNFEDFVPMLKSNNRGNWKTRKHLLVNQRQSGISKREECDFSRITMETILAYLRTGRICGFRVTTVRFGLGGRR